MTGRPHAPGRWRKREKMKNTAVKTNAIRLLTQKKAVFKTLCYEPPENAFSGTEVAAILGKDPAKVFKTLVTTGKSGEHYVFMIPVAAELDLKKAAEAAGEKNIAMLKAKDLLGLTGYVHGGCSPVGMKKQFVSFMDKSAQEQDTIVLSGGKVGVHIEITPAELRRAVPFSVAELT